MKRATLIFMVLASLPFSLLAQNTGTGVQPFGSYSSFGFDTLNNQNLNAYFAIPLTSSTGRGLPLSVTLTNNSLIWQAAGTAWAPVVDQSGNPTWGWLKDIPTGGTIQYKSSTASLKCAPGTQFYPVTTYNNYVYLDALGTAHPAGSISFRRSLCASQNFGTDAAYVDDHSGYYISDPGGGAPTVKGPHGDEGVNGAGTAVDVNGNYITKTVVGSTETDYTNSVGNTALKILYTPNSTSPTKMQYEFLDGTGNYQTITLFLTATSIKTNFGCSGLTEYSGTANLPTELDIPTPSGATLKYLFTYEETPSHSGYYTGRVQRIALPTGGYYEYDYAGSNDSVNCSDGTTTSVSRVVSDGTSTATWNFSRNVSSRTTTVTTPQLADTTGANDTKYTFNSTGQETTRQIYANSPGTGILRTINTTWASNGTPSKQVTILEDNSTQSETDTTFDSNGLLDSMSEYDWGTGSRGSLLRTTTLTYQTSTNYTSRNIINLVTSQVIKDNSGTTQYRQDITYDGVALGNCPTGVPQHDDTDFACSMNYRGNPTAVTTYVNPATQSNPITKNFTYDWFGNPLTITVSSCQIGTWNYSAQTEYSQPDSLVRGCGPQLTTSYTYNAYTGQEATSVDENSQATHYYYDFLERPTSVVHPDSSVITYNYNDATFTATTETPIDVSKTV